jgi:hypothetical protein
VLLALHRRGNVNGFITNDDGILQLPREMVVLMRTTLCMVITKGVGHAPVRATGLLMTHLEEIVKRIDGKPQIYILRGSQLQSITPGSQINKIAIRVGLSPNDIISREDASMGFSARGDSTTNHQ